MDLSFRLNANARGHRHVQSSGAACSRQVLNTNFSQYRIIDLKQSNLSQSRTNIQVQVAQVAEQVEYLQLVQFKVPIKTPYGAVVKVVGPGEELGDWNPQNALELTWTEGNVWESKTFIPIGQVEFKLIIEHSDGHVEWEVGNNRFVDTTCEDGLYPLVSCTFNDMDSLDTEILENYVYDDEDDIPEKQSKSFNIFKIFSN